MRRFSLGKSFAMDTETIVDSTLKQPDLSASKRHILKIPNLPSNLIFREFRENSKRIRAQMYFNCFRNSGLRILDVAFQCVEANKPHPLSEYIIVIIAIA